MNIKFMFKLTKVQKMQKLGNIYICGVPGLLWAERMHTGVELTFKPYSHISQLSVTMIVYNNQCIKSFANFLG